eukprot:COSAG02_NODE_14539_length_1261_cov_1.252151_2_plen_314_part_01
MRAQPHTPAGSISRDRRRERADGTRAREAPPALDRSIARARRRRPSATPVRCSTMAFRKKAPPGMSRKSRRSWSTSPPATLDLAPEPEPEPGLEPEPDASTELLRQLSKEERERTKLAKIEAKQAGSDASVLARQLEEVELRIAVESASVASERAKTAGHLQRRSRNRYGGHRGTIDAGVAPRRQEYARPATADPPHSSWAIQRALYERDRALQADQEQVRAEAKASRLATGTTHAAAAAEVARNLSIDARYGKAKAMQQQSEEHQAIRKLEEQLQLVRKQLEQERLLTAPKDSIEESQCVICLENHRIGLRCC